MAALCHPGGGRPGGPSAERLTGVVLALFVVCARVPMLIWVRGPGWFRAGDMMVMGSPAGGRSMRPLSLCRPFPAGGAAAQRQELAAVHRLTWG